MPKSYGPRGQRAWTGAERSRRWRSPRRCCPDRLRAAYTRVTFPAPPGHASTCGSRLSDSTGICTCPYASDCATGLAQHATIIQAVCLQGGRAHVTADTMSLPVEMSPMLFVAMCHLHAGPPSEPHVLQQGAVQGSQWALGRAVRRVQPRIGIEISAGWRQDWS